MTQQVFDQMPPDPAPGADSRGGIIGDRHLLAVQTFDIARLTTYPVPLVPGTFIAVSGVGPKGDSNGSGKTSFLGAVSLLLGEAQWRLESDSGRSAAGLLWRPQAAGVAAEDRYLPADFGYIVGVFADPLPAGLTVEQARAHLNRTAITVWLRLSATPKYIRVRWTLGLHVAEAADDAERYAEANRRWHALPPKGELGPQRMAAALYGEAPRCMAYLDTTLRKAAPSLLSQQMTEMRPEEIGESLIALTGRDNLLETEQEQRRTLADHQVRLHEKQTFHATRLREGDADLDGVRARNRARDLLDEGEHLWRLHNARGYLDARTAFDEATVRVERAKGAMKEGIKERDRLRVVWGTIAGRTDLEETEQTAYEVYRHAEDKAQGIRTRDGVLRSEIARLGREKTPLLGQAADWSGTPVPTLLNRETAARGKATNAEADRLTAQRAHAAAETALTEAEAGGGGPAGQARTVLLDAGIPAAILLDQITLTPDARPAWEPRLYPHRAAVVIAPEHRDRAATTLADQPGAALVLADGPLDTDPGPLPDGVITTLPLAGFLAILDARTRHEPTPDRAHDADLGETTLGGFPTEIAGRAARITAARAARDDAHTRLGAATGTARLANLALEEAGHDRAAGEAAARIARLEDEIAEQQAALAALAEPLRAHTQAAETAHQAWTTAKALKEGHEREIELARNAFTFAEQQATRLTAEHADRENERRQVRVDWWTQQWPDGRDAAEALLAEQPDDLRDLKPVSYRGRAADALKDALSAYESAVTELPPELEEAKRRRQALLEGEPVDARTVDFTSIAAPLRDLLDAAADRDRLMEERIALARAERDRDLASAAEEIDGITGDLRATQDMTARSLLTALGRISERLDELSRERGGHGAELRIEHEPPDSPGVPWRWKVTPRWRRSATGGLVSYREVANGAQVKVFAIQLVLAALLAAEGAGGRMLVLDELGNSLGDTNRRNVLAALHQVAADKDLTILGTCQDSVIGDAAQQCGEVLWFHHASDADPYNQPTRAWGYDAQDERVRLIAPWLRAGRDLA
jgi:hypothetical protein